MNAGRKRSFYYNSHANALGGVLRQPLQRVFSSGASVSLATAGGFGSARSERFHVDELISFESAHVQVSGSEHANSWRSVATTVIEGLNILEIVTADRIVAQVSHSYPKDSHGPVRFALLGTQYENLRVNGVTVTPTLDPRIFGAGRANGAWSERGTAENTPLSFAEFKKVASEQYQEYKTLAIPDFLQERLEPRDQDTELAEKGSVLCSLVKGVTAATPVPHFGPIMPIPDFGNVFFGEILVDPASINLTMLRFDLGCMAEGDVSACSAASDGRGVP